MFHTNKPSSSFINSEEYRDKVLGCWMGKNIGGTLGAPMEGQTDIFDVTFYTQDLKGNPAPNDDLDLQLIWLKAVEDHGITNINERLLGEYWMTHIAGPWNEYGNAKFNIANGLLPPLSGACNNDAWKISNGAWIRSEIWACLFPGEPEEAMPYAWYDACVDHAGDGIYAELFTTALESAAFIENDVRKLIDYALVRIPENCRVARSVKIVLDAFEKGEDWKTARNRVVEDSADLGWFQAPANVAFVIIGLLYGQSDFGKSICIAVNCGDDTDCTGATCGSILGIMKGRSGIPQEWIEPIGETIKTIAIAPFHADAPKTLEELTNRVIVCKKQIDAINPCVIRLTEGETTISDESRARLSDGSDTVKRILSKSSMSLEIPLPYATLSLEFEKSPVVKPGETQKLTLTLGNCSCNDCSVLSVEWLLPEGWSIAEGRTQRFITSMYYSWKTTINLTVGEIDGLEYIPVVFRLSGRSYPIHGIVTFQQAGTVVVDSGAKTTYQPYWDKLNLKSASRQ